MNMVILTGRLVRDPEIKTYGQDQRQMGTFTLAVDRGYRDGGADFLRIVTFGKTAENCAKYLTKGSKVAVEGRIQTGSYEKNGQKIYTCDVIAERVEFIGTGKKENDGEGNESFSAIPEGFEEIDDIPF